MSSEARAPGGTWRSRCRARWPGSSTRVKNTARARARALIAPAISFAKRGFVLDQGDVALLAIANADFKDDDADGGHLPQPGQAVQGRRAAGAEGSGEDPDADRAARRRRRSTEGPVADAIAASSAAGKGIITKADLRQYKVRELAPVECDYRGYRIVSAPPPSSGGVAICEILNILEGYPLKRPRISLGAGGALSDRSDAPRVHRPQQLSRRS